jgi:homoserine trans-succinylase
MAKGYGDVYLVLNAKPLKPVVVNNVNEAEIYLQGLVTDYCKKHGQPRSLSYFEDNTSYEEEIMKKGFDGMVIKGREMVNFKPGKNVKYFKTDQELYDYWQDYIND